MVLARKMEMSPMPERVRVLKSIERIESFMGDDWHISPDDVMVPFEEKKAMMAKLAKGEMRVQAKAYQVSTSEEKEKLVYRKKNKLRNAWFTNLVGNISLATKYLPQDQKLNIKAKSRLLLQEVRNSEMKTVEMIEKAEELAHYAVSLLHDKVGDSGARAA